MKEDIPVSILMPVYNAEKYLDEAIESILRQTYRNFEFIIVENGSTDSSKEIIRHYAQLDGRIKPYFMNGKGLVNALNFGLHIAKYNWIARMDADDISLPERLELQLDVIRRKPNLAAVSSYAYYISEDGNRILGKMEIGPITVDEYRMLVDKNKLIFIFNPSVVLNKEVVIQVGSYRDLPVLEDLDLFCRIGDTGKIILVLPKILMKYRKIYSSETSSKFLLLQNTMRWIKYAMLQRRDGKRESTPEEFIHILNRDPIYYKLLRYRQDFGIYFFKKSGLALSYGKYIQFVYYGIISFLVIPEYFIKRVKGMLT